MPKSGSGAIESIISGDGKFFIFTSKDPLHPKAKKDVVNVYRRSIDTQGNMGAVELVSFLPPTTLYTPCQTTSLPMDTPDGNSYNIASSYDGNIITFLSQATNLSPTLYCETATDPHLTKTSEFTSVQAYRMDMTTSSLDLVSGYSVTGQAGKSPNFLSTHGVTVSGNGRMVAYTSPDCGIDSLPKELQIPFDKICMYDSSTKKTTLVSAPAPMRELNGHSFQPVLNDSGNVLAFTSYANLIPEDKTPVTAKGIEVSNIYRIEFPLVAGVPDFSRRSKIEIVDADTNSAFSTTGIFGSSSPSITADGRYVLFQSAMPPGKMIDGWGPNGITTIVDYAGIFIYITDAQSGKTSLVSVQQSESGGSKTFALLDYTKQQNSFNAFITPNGKYVSFTTDALAYTNTKMKQYNSPVPGIGLSCNSMLFSSLENQTLQIERGVPQMAKLWGNGWKSARDCLSAINPNTYGKSQVYMAELDFSGAPRVSNVLPLSITPPLIIGNFVTDWWKTPLSPTEVLIKYGPVWQSLFGDKNSISGTQGISDDKRIVFLSAADNLNGSKLDRIILERKLLNADGTYEYVPPSDVVYILKNPLQRQVLREFYYEPENPFESVELYYNQVSSKGYYPFIYTQGAVGVEQ